jgi:hypothetical protein
MGEGLAEYLHAGTGIDHPGSASSEIDPSVTIFGVAEDADLVTRYRDAGVARVVFGLPPARADEVVPVLDRCAALMRQLGA